MIQIFNLICSIFIALVFLYIEAIINNNEKSISINKKGIFCILGSLGLSALLSGLLYFVLQEHLTIYEFCGCVCVCSLLLVMMLRILQNKMSVEILLKDLMLIVIVIVLYSIVTYGQTVINSDVATGSLQPLAQRTYGSTFPRSWVCANGDIWILGFSTFTFPFSAILENQPLARMLGSAAISIAVMVMIAFFIKKSLKSKAYPITIVMWFLLLFGSYEMILYQAAYTSSVLNMLLYLTCLYLLFFDSCRISKKCAILIWIICNIVVFATSSMRWGAELLIPCVLSFVIHDYFNTRNNKRIIWKTEIGAECKKLIKIIVPALAGIFVYKILCGYCTVRNTSNNSAVFVADLEQLRNNFQFVIWNWLDCFGYKGGAKAASIDGIRNLFSICLCLLICVIVPVLQAKKIKEESREFQFIFIFSLIHNFEMFFIGVAFGKLFSYYLLTSVFMFIVISSCYIYKYFICQNDWKKIVWTVGYSVILVIYGLALLLHSVNWTDTLNKKIEFNNIIKSHNVNKGYAQFWNAYENSVYSNFDISYGAVNFYDVRLEAYPWLVDSNVFRPEDKNTFLIMTEEELELVGPNLEIICGTPLESFLLDDKWIYIFDHDIAADFRNDFEDGILKPNEIRTEGTVEVTHDNVTIIGDGSCFAYILFEPGEYEIKFVGENMYNLEYYLDVENLKISESRDDEAVSATVVCEKDCIAKLEFRNSNIKDKTKLQFITCEKK